MFEADKTVGIINWDGVLQPRAGSPRTILNAIMAFSELYLYPWSHWLAKLPCRLAQPAYMAIIAANVPRVIALYVSAKVQNAINQLKLGQMPETDFFNQLLQDHFGFLLTSDLSSAKGLPSNLDQKGKAIFLLKRAWCYPRIQELTALEIERFKKIMQQFDRVILISNSNMPDIECFITNLLKANILDQASHQGRIFDQLVALSKPGDPVAAIETVLLRVNDKVSILASPFTHEWKVQTGKVAATTGSAGFLPTLLSSMAKAEVTVISDAPSDRTCVKKPGAQTYSSGGYFKDQTQLQQFALGAYDNWPILTALTIGLAIILYLLSSFR